MQVLHQPEHPGGTDVAQGEVKVAGCQPGWNGGTEDREGVSTNVTLAPGATNAMAGPGNPSCPFEYMTGEALNQCPRLPQGHSVSIDEHPRGI